MGNNMVVAVDNGGEKHRLEGEIELRTNIDWEKICSLIDESNGIDIITYSQYEAEVLWKYLSNRQNVRIIINEKSLFNTTKARDFENETLEHEVIRVNNSRAKMILAAPNIVCLSSQNIGNADWLQNTVIFRDIIVYEFYKNEFDKYVATGKVNNYQGNGAEKFSYTNSCFAKSGNKEVLKHTVTIRKPYVKLEKMLNWKTKVTGIWYKEVFISSYTLPKENYVKDTLKKLLQQGNHVTFLINAKSANRLEKIREELMDELEESFLYVKQFKKKYIVAREQLEYILKTNDNIFDIEVRTNVHAKVLMAGKDKISGGGEEVVWLSSQNFGASGWFENMVAIYGTEAYNFYSKVFSEFLS